MPEPTASFAPAERERLLKLKGVGPTVLVRLEQLGISSMDQLAAHSAEDICRRVSISLGSTCWGNSPLARAALGRAIAEARKGAAT